MNLTRIFSQSVPAIFLTHLCLTAHAQVNSGSNGSDGAFNPTTNTVINMADHPDGIYHYTSVVIPVGVTVSFIPNAANTPVVWLVQSNCVIAGNLNLSGLSGSVGGPGGHRGGYGAGGDGALPGDGVGPGGGIGGTNGICGGNGSFGTLGQEGIGGVISQNPSGPGYGNVFLLPLIGGSGGGGLAWNAGQGASTGTSGGGGGGAILIAASDTVQIDGSIQAPGGEGGIPYPYYETPGAGGGSGGAVRILAKRILGVGSINVQGGQTSYYRASWCSCYWRNRAGSGRIRMDSPDNNFLGVTTVEVSRGFQPIIIAPTNQAVSLAIQNVGGVAVVANPTGVPTTPDVVVPGAQQNPVSIVVRCVNIPLNTDIIVDVKPANGPTVRVVGVNNSGSQASSIATVSITMPRGAGTIQAKAISGIAGSLGASLNSGERFRNYAQSGLTTDGELFAKMEITATLGKGQEIAYITESGKRFVIPSN